MKCEEYTENGRDSGEALSRPIWNTVRQECRHVDRSHMLGFASSLPRAVCDRQVHLDLVSFQPPTDSHSSEPPRLDLPFMSTMDEITYWIYTKRAPCLLQYDIVAKKQQQVVAHCSKTEQKIPSSILDNVTSPKKKKKRKLTILEDGSVSEKIQNVYFDVSKQQNDKTVLSSCKSETIGSNADDNIKKSSMRNKRKRLKLQKNSQAMVNKNNKIITSTPRETTRLRRNLRKAPKDLNNSSQYNSSFKVNNGTINGNNPSTPKKPEKKVIEESKDSEKEPQNRLSKLSLNSCEKVKNGATFNGQFEDLSDVSGFTANYIRSTKVQATKSTRKLRGKGNHSFVKGIKMGDEVDNAMVVCVNKSTNPGLSKTALNCSSDSSQNIVNLVTVKNASKDTKVHRSTSALKFINTSLKSKEGVKFKIDDDKQPSNVNVPFQTCTTSRYPKRTKHVSDQILNNSTVNSSLKRKCNKNNSVNNSERKENPEEMFPSKTRSGRSLGLSLCVPENSVLVVNNSTEQMSSAVSMNVALPGSESPTKKRVSPRKCTRSKKNVDKSTHRTSVRDKSGFSACFSDSEDDKPLKLHKFFE